MNAEGAPALIIYDGDCIFCQNYVRLVRLRDTIGPVELLDARSGDPRLEGYWRDGYDLNEGMLFVHRGRVFHGHEAISLLAQLSTGAGWFNRLNRLTLSNRYAAALIYPFLKLGRRATLILRGRSILEKA